MREDVPASLMRRLSDSERSSAAEWWRSLPFHEREAVTVLVRSSRRGLVCQFVEEPAVDDRSSEEPDDLYEYLVNHEIALLPLRKLHICTTELEAREAVDARRVPSTFQCPRAAAGGPMRRLIRAAGGRDVRIAIAPSDGGGQHG